MLVLQQLIHLMEGREQQKMIYKNFLVKVQQLHDPMNQTDSALIC